MTCRKPNRRWENGKGYLKKCKGKYTQPLLAHVILKYGWENFSHEIIKEGLTQEEASVLEYELIESWKTRNPEFGYNLSYGGIFHSKTEEEKQKISKSNKEYYKTHVHHAKGVKKSEEEKQHMREIMLGRFFSDETKKKMSENHCDVTFSNNPRAKKVKCVETGEIFSCAKEAGLIYNNVPTNPRCRIRDCCNGRRKTSGKHKKLENLCIGNGLINK